MNYRLSSLVALGVMGITSPAAAQLFDAPVALGPALFTNYIQLVDLDGDGDLDIVAPNCSGFMSTGAQAMEVYRNNGSGVFADYGFPLGNTAKPVRQVALGDADGDGDVDVYVPDASTGPHLFYVNDGGGNFTDEAATRLPSGFVSRAGATEFGDVDNDGDLDLFVGDAYSQGFGPTVQGHVLTNDGNGVFVMGAASPSGSGADPIDVDFADVDRDWDLDILINVHDGESLLWLNDGFGVFTDATANVHAMEGWHYGPSLCDVDGDGDVDLWTDNAGPGLADTLATNDGLGVFTDMTSSLVTGNPSSADDNGVICVDIDQDGDLDGAVVSLSTPERILVNDSGTFTYLQGQFPTGANDNSLWLDFGDVDGDGRLDAVTGQGEPADVNKVFVANGTMPVDAQPPRIIAVQQVGAGTGADTPAVLFAVSDAVVTDTGPRLARAFVTVETDSSVEVEAAFSGGDLFRAVLPAHGEGTVVTYTACAVDRQGNEGCAQPLSYTVGQPPTGAGGAGGAGVGGGASSGPGSTSGAGGSDGLDVEDEGCDCSLPGRSGDPRPWLAALGLVVLWRRRRR